MLKKIPLILILVAAFLLCVIPLKAHDIPLSWEGYYHMRIAGNITEKNYFYDSGSFGPDGRTQLHPPLFHVFSAALLMCADPLVVTRWTPPFLFCAVILIWYMLISRLYGESTALISALFLLCIPAFVDIGFLFSPQSFSLMLVFSALLFAKKNPVLSGVLGGLIIMTYFAAAFYFFLVIFTWLSLESKKGTALKISAISLITAFLYLIYFAYNFPSAAPVLGFSGLQYLLSKITFAVPTLAVLGLRKDYFAVSLGAGALLSFMQPAHICYVAFPLALFSSFFLHRFLLYKKWTFITFIFVFWLCFIPSSEYAAKLQPAASEYSSFVWLKEHSVPTIVASGWYQAPLIASVSERTPVLGYGLADEYRVNNVNLLYKGDMKIMDLYQVSYVYFGAYEKYDYQKVALELDRVYVGKGAFYKREPSTILVLLTVDVEPDLPPVLSSYQGVEQGLSVITQLLGTYGVEATFFVLGETAEKYPAEIKALGQHHEIGCHSMYHYDLQSLSLEEKEHHIQKATTLLRKYGAVTSFRAPGHSCDTEVLQILLHQGYTVEASACAQWSYPYHPAENDWLAQGEVSLLRVPVSHAPSYFYGPLIYPDSWINAYIHILGTQKDQRVKIVVIGLHPWECVPLDAPGYKLYTRACGEYTRTELLQLLQFLDKRSVAFITMNRLYELWKFIE